MLGSAPPGLVGGVAGVSLTWSVMGEGEEGIAATIFG